MSARWHPSQMAAGQNATPAAQVPAASNEGAAGNGVVPAQASSRWHPSGMAPAGEVPAAEGLAGQGAGPSADARALVHQLPTPDERRVIALAEGESPDVPSQDVGGRSGSWMDVSRRTRSALEGEGEPIRPAGLVRSLIGVSDDTAIPVRAPEPIARKSAKDGRPPSGAEKASAERTGGDGTVAAAAAALQPSGQSVPNELGVWLSAAEQKDSKRLKAARLLLEQIPMGKTHMGQDSRIPCTEHQRCIQALEILMAGSSARNDSARRTLQKWSEFLTRETSEEQTPESIFPIDARSLKALKTHLLATSGGKTAAEDLEVNMDFLRSLGLPVPTPEECACMLKTKVVQRPPGESTRPNARSALGPKACIDVERASVTGFPHGVDEQPLVFAQGESPFQVYAMAEWMMLVGCDRGDGVWGATFQAGNSPEPDTIRYVTAIDGKAGRCEVEQYVPLGGFEIERHTALEAHAKRMEGCPLIPAFRYNNGGGAYIKPDLATGWTSGKMESAPCALESNAKKAISHVRSLSVGMDEAELKSRNLTGTHPDRHDAPEASGQLQWPAPEVDALGDWAPKKEVPTRSSRSGRKLAGANARSRAGCYKPNAIRGDIIKSRSRWIAAARAFIAHAGGYDALTYDTTWADIIPRVPPSEEFKEFYGPTWAAGGS